MKLLQNTSAIFMCMLPKKKLEDIVLTVIEAYKNMWHHIYQDNYYNSVNMAKALLQSKIRVCGTIRKNRGLPLLLQIIKLSRGQHVFHRTMIFC